MTEETKTTNPIPRPATRDYAEGYCAALKQLCHSINFATARAKKGEMKGLETAFNLSKQLYDNMYQHLQIMTGEVLPIPESEVLPSE